MYVADQRTGILFQVFAIVAIIISCLGLFGLATYTAQIKTKEIGIRRVLGATVTQVTSLLAREFILLVGISLLIATPLAWWSMTQWLQNYIYRTHLNAWIFLATGGTVLFLALLTVCIQAVRAALANPVPALDGLAPRERVVGKGDERAVDDEDQVAGEALLTEDHEDQRSQCQPCGQEPRPATRLRSARP